ncbi:hypothetical protein IB270_34650 [Ensifer sp. ENS05]|uniref:hypothetical protein n=1 Tax=Ensifer sp. ENS05 TaxID=2769277 RepID=UPI001786DBBF|nr:hypothetical protein [Ensifer sp. ENS05]MBD9597967.1 hypothetical protein [Ensifer sp. ENS05]
MRVIDIEAMVAGGPDALILPDMTLNALGTRLGVPEWWNFADEKPFGALLGYGDFEMMVWASRNQIQVKRVGVELWTAVNGDPVPKEKIWIAKGVKVHLGPFVPGMFFDDAVLKLKAMGKRFRVASYDDASEVKKVIFLGKRCKLVFFDMMSNLGLAEIHFFSSKGDS